MKKQLLILFLSIISFAAFAQNEDTDKPSKFEFIASSKIGSANLSESGNVLLSGFLKGADVMLSMNINKKVDISTGLGYYEFFGNRTVAGATASLKNSYLQIPLMVKSDFKIIKYNSDNPHVLFSLGGGFYGRGLMKQEIETVLGKENTKNMGWNTGFMAQAGVKFIASDNFRIGIGFEGQSDLTKMRKNEVKQKIQESNLVYFSIGLHL